jgi:hypothetical protein
MTAPGAPPLSLRALQFAIVVIGTLAAAPFLLASVVSERRFSDATAEATRIAAALAGADAIVPDVHLMIGLGNLPRFDDHPEWRAGTSALLSRAIGLQADADVLEDPWRNAYLVNAGSRGRRVVLSSGPNGIVETPFEAAETPVGDDVAVLIGAVTAHSSSLP